MAYLDAISYQTIPITYQNRENYGLHIRSNADSGYRKMLAHPTDRGGQIRRITKTFALIIAS